MAKFCLNCGTPVQPTDAFCTSCGYALVKPAQQPQYVSPPVEDAALGVPLPPQYPPQPPIPNSEFQIPNTPTPPQYQQPQYPPHEDATVGAPLSSAPQQYQPPQYQQPQYPPAPAAPAKKKSKAKLFIILGAVLVVLVIGIILIVNIVTGLTGKTAKLDYFEIGDDKIPTVKLALGEERTVVSYNSSVSGKVTIKTIEYSVSGSKQGNDMFDYYLYLRDDGYLTLTEIDFSGSRGTAIVGKNSVDDGYEIQLQIEYDYAGYTITILKQPGGITTYEPSDGSSDDSDISSANGGGGESASEPEKANDRGNSEPESNAGNSSPSDNGGSGKEPESSGSGDSKPENSGSEKEPENTGGDSDDPKTAKLTADVLATISSGTYHMKMGYLIEGAEGMETDIYCNYGYTAMVMNTGDIEMRMVYAEDYCFIIMDEYETIYVYDAVGSYEVPDMGDTSGLTFVGEGSGEFNGKTLKYDEYVAVEGSRHFYFMDGGVLRGIRAISDGVTMDIEILAFDTNVPDKVFSIPDDYEVIDFTN